MTTAKSSLTLAALMSAAMVLSVQAEDRQQGSGTQEKSQEVQKKGKGKKQRNSENGADAVFASAAWHADLAAGEEPA